MSGHVTCVPKGVSSRQGTPKYRDGRRTPVAGDVSPQDSEDTDYCLGYIVRVELVICVLSQVLCTT